MLAVKSLCEFFLFCLLTVNTWALPSVRHFSMGTAREKGSTLSKKDNCVDAPVVVTVNLQQSLSIITDHFVGVNIDMAMVRGNWSSLDFSSTKVQNMARALTPTFFRLGGGSADSVTYVLDDQYYLPTSNNSNFSMTAQQWLAVNEFVKTVGWDFIMDINELKRNADGSWNPDNARQLLQFSADRNYTIAGFEMGNEYDIFENKFHMTLPPAQLAKDVENFLHLLAEFPRYYSSFIIGPKTASSRPEYFQGENLSDLGYRGEVANAAKQIESHLLKEGKISGRGRTYGFLSVGTSCKKIQRRFGIYYFKGRDGKLSNFTDRAVLDSLASHVDDVWNQSRSVDPQLPLWLSETSSSSGGGTPGISDRFAAGFLWLDKLGVCASKGIETLLRQDFFGGNYPLIDHALNPNPDFWLTVLYKRIVRGAVFNATGRHDVRVYAACANTDSFDAGSLVVYTLNPNSFSVTFDLPQFQSQPCLLYSLTSGDGDGLLSKYISLNGVKLELVNGELPDLKAESAPPGVVTVAPYSYTFLVFPEARVSICLH